MLWGEGVGNLNKLVIAFIYKCDRRKEGFPLFGFHQSHRLSEMTFISLYEGA